MSHFQPCLPSCAPPYYESIAPPSVSTSPQKRRVLLKTPSIKPILHGLGKNYNTDKTTTKDNTKHMHSNKKEAKTPTFNSNTKQQSIQSEKSKHTNNT